MNVKNDNISKLQFDEFLRAIGISKNDTFSLLLGAGCSINSDFLLLRTVFGNGKGIFTKPITLLC